MYIYTFDTFVISKVKSCSHGKSLQKGNSFTQRGKDNYIFKRMLHKYYKLQLNLVIALFTSRKDWSHYKDHGARQSLLRIRGQHHELCRNPVQMYTVHIPTLHFDIQDKFCISCQRSAFQPKSYKVLRMSIDLRDRGRPSDSFKDISQCRDLHISGE